MAILDQLKTKISAVWRKALSLALELERKLAGPGRVETDAKRDRDESVFQPRKF